MLTDRTVPAVVMWPELGGRGWQGTEAWAGQGVHPEHTAVTESRVA